MVLYTITIVHRDYIVNENVMKLELQFFKLNQILICLTGLVILCPLFLAFPLAQSSNQVKANGIRGSIKG